MMSISAKELNVILSARDRKFTQAMERAEKRAVKFASKTEKELNKTTKAFNKVANAAKTIGPALGVSAVVAGLGKIVSEAGDTAKEIQKLATLSGVGVERFQELAFAAKTVGVDQEKLADILKDTNDKFGDFLSTGAGPLKDFFEQIAPKVDITAEAFRGLSSEQALGLYVKKLQEAGVNQQELTFFMEALASDATLLAPLLLNDASALDEMSNSARELGAILSEDLVGQTALLEDEFNKTITAMQTKFMTFVMTVANGANQLFNITDMAKRNDVIDEIAEIERKQTAIVNNMAK